MEDSGGFEKDLNDGFGGKCSGSTVAVVWHQLSAEEAEAGMMVADVLAVWWLEERQLVVTGRVVKMAVVC